MDERIRPIAYVLGTVCGCCVTGMVVVAACGQRIPDILKTLASTTAGALISLLAYTLSSSKGRRVRDHGDREAGDGGKDSTDAKGQEPPPRQRRNGG